MDDCCCGGGASLDMANGLDCCNDNDGADEDAMDDDDDVGVGGETYEYIFTYI